VNNAPDALVVLRQRFQQRAAARHLATQPTIAIARFCAAGSRSTTSPSCGALLLLLPGAATAAAVALSGRMLAVRRRVATA